MRKRRVAILTPDLRTADAVGLDTLRLEQVFRNLGWESRVFAPTGQSGLSFHAPRRVASFLDRADDLLIYQFAVAYEFGERVFRDVRCRRALRHHNVTPAEYYAPYNHSIAEACRLGSAALPRLISEAVSVYLPASEFNRRELILAGVPAERCHVLAPLSDDGMLREEADLDWLGRLALDPERPCQWLCVGRLVPNKNHRALLLALAAFRKRYDARARLLFVGTKPAGLESYFAELQRLTEELDLTQAVWFSGSVSRARLKACFLAADVLVSASVHEGFCVPLVEAMALGLPVVALSRAAVPETVGEAGLLASSDDPEAFAELTARVTHDAEVRARLIRAGLERYAERFRPELAEVSVAALFGPGSDEPKGEGHETADPPPGAQLTQAAQPAQPARANSRPRPSVAFVVQRFGADIVGGAEQLARAWAGLLADEADVMVLTTTARDDRTWANELAPGRERMDGYEVVRFSVERTRGDYFHRLHAMLQNTDGPWRGLPPRPGRPGFSHALEREWLRAEGPLAPGLLKHIEQLRDLRCIVFFSYLYPTTVFGLERARARSVLVPTLHAELPAYFDTVREAARGAQGRIWISRGERELSGRLWDLPEGPLVGMPLPVGSQDAGTRGLEHLPGRGEEPHRILYVGRLDPGKGVGDLIAFHRRFVETEGLPVELLLCGRQPMPLPDSPDVRLLGFVSEEEKRGWMRSAEVFVMPSAHESLSITLLESMLEGTPVLVNLHSAVLRDHVELSGGGLTYRSYAEFATGLRRLLGSASLRQELGQSGRTYARSMTNPDAIRSALREALGLS